MALILIADDDREIRQTLQMILEDAGYQVGQAMHGKDALDIIRASVEPLIVLLDRRMPHLDGLGVLKMLNQEPEVARRHIYILMSAMAGALPLDFMLLKQHLDISLLAKPFDLDVLLAVIAQAVERLASAER